MKRMLRWIFAAVVPFLVVPSLVVLSLIEAASPAGAQALGLEPEVEAARRRGAGIPVGPGLWRLHGVEPDLGRTDDLAPLRRMIGKATVVGLGESWHTSGGFYKMKHRIFRDLVETMGFRAFAIESHWVSGEKANRYVQTCEGSPEEALDLHIPVWQSVEVSDLLQWMCEWNQAHPNDRVHYFGFDMQGGGLGPNLDGPGLIAFLGRIGVPEGHPWVAGIRQCEGVTATHPAGQIPADVHQQCISALTEIEDRFQRDARSIEEQTSQDDFFTARLQVLSLKAWQEEVFLIGTDAVGEDFARGFNKRDEAMAKVFFLLREKNFPKAKTVVWADNVHVARALLPKGLRPMGSFLAAKLGRGYVDFALTAYHTGVEGGQTCQVREAVPGSVEDRLHALGEDALLVDLARSSYLKPRVYLMGGLFTYKPRQHFNGIIFLETSERMRSTSGPPCQP